MVDWVFSLEFNWQSLGRNFAWFCFFYCLNSVIIFVIESLGLNSGCFVVTEKKCFHWDQVCSIIVALSPAVL